MPMGAPRRTADPRPPAEGGAIAAASGPGLVAARPFAYGDSVLREAPLLLIPKRAADFLRSVGTAPMNAVAERLGDAVRLAAFAAFLRLPESDQEAVLAMGVSSGSKTVEGLRKVTAMFLGDFPQFKDAFDWDLFARVVGVVTDRGSVLRNGDRALYRLSDQASHSCAPNAVVESLGDGSVKELRVIAHRGIAENEAITVSYCPEEVLMLPLEGRCKAIKEARGGWVCKCTRCAAGEDAEPVMALIKRPMGLKKADVTEARVRECVEDLSRLDALLPFALVGKARARARIAQAIQEVFSDDHALLPEALELYEASLDETGTVLGQKGLQQADNVKRSIEKLRERLD